MKSLVLTAAAVAAGLCFAEGITSANVVGFQEIPVTKFSTHANTFTSMTKTEANMSIGDITTNSKSDGKNHKTTGWDPDNDLFYLVDQTGKMSHPYYNVPLWQAKESSDWVEGDEGWYDYYDDEDYIKQNDLIKIAFGDGFIVQSSSAEKGKDPRLVFSGQVKQVAKDIPVTKFIMVGNCSPTDLTIDDLTTNSESDGKNHKTMGWDPDNDLLYFVDETGKMSHPYYNVPVWQAKESSDWVEGDEGWYDYYDDEDYIKQTLPIPSGTGFIVQSSSAEKGKEPVIIVPSALKSDN